MLKTRTTEQSIVANLTDQCRKHGLANFLVEIDEYSPERHYYIRLDHTQLVGEIRKDKVTGGYRHFVEFPGKYDGEFVTVELATIGEMLNTLKFTAGVLAVVRSQLDCIG